MTTNHYESTGSYTVEMVGEQRRLFRLKRSSNGGMDLASAVENSLLAFINDSEYYPLPVIKCMLNNIVLWSCNSYCLVKKDAV